MSVVLKDRTGEFPMPVQMPPWGNSNTTTPKHPRADYAVLLVAALCLALAWVLAVPAKSEASWQYTQASYYNIPGGRTACGQTMTTSSWWVASLGGSRRECGKRLTLCRRGRCVHVRVRDTGGYHSGRKWDLTPRVKRALRCGDLCQVRWARDFQ